MDDELRPCPECGTILCRSGAEHICPECGHVE